MKPKTVRRGTYDNIPVLDRAKRRALSAVPQVQKWSVNRYGQKMYERETVLAEPLRKKGIDTLVQATKRGFTEVYRMEYTPIHSAEVAVLCFAAAVAAYNYGAIKDQRLPKACFEGGLIHDCGKIFIPPELLCGKKLNDTEIWLIRDGHIAYGLGLAHLHWDGSETMRASIMMLAQHHVTFNGLDSTKPSYPEGLIGEECTLPSRIVKVADFISAQLQPRFYVEETGIGSLQALMAYAVLASGRELCPEALGFIISGIYDVDYHEVQGMVGILSCKNQEEIRSWKAILPRVRQVISDARFRKLVGDRKPGFGKYLSVLNEEIREFDPKMENQLAALSRS